MYTASSSLPLVKIWTDGGCRPNPGPGGWGAILQFHGVERELSGAEANTTNNRMELTAATIALETLTKKCRVSLYTDSEYVKNGVTRWSIQWINRNWRKSSGGAVVNVDLWKRLLDAASQHNVTWHWVKGHSGNIYNERADTLATLARESLEI